jgi:hypothetical protein
MVGATPVLRKEKPVLAPFELTPTAGLDEWEHSWTRPAATVARRPVFVPCESVASWL